MLNFINQLNFVDIIIIIITLRICYIAAVMGLVIELFKLSGLLFATYISLHYYTSVSDIIGRNFLPKGMPLEFIDFLIFVILAVTAYLVFIVLRSIFYRVIKLEATPKINKIGGLILGVARAYFTIGLLIFTLLISSVSYLKNSAAHSYLGSRAFLIAPRAYNWIWESIISKFSPKEKFNPTVKEITGKYDKK